MKTFLKKFIPFSIDAMVWQHTGNKLEPRAVRGTLLGGEPFRHAPSEANIVVGKSDTVIRQNVVFRCTPGTLYQLLFGSDISYLKNLVAKQNSFDISDISGLKAKRRDYTYTKRLNCSIWPKQTKCFITETLENDDTNSYIRVKQISKTLDVPSGNSFHVQTSFHLSWGGNNTTKMSVVTNVVWAGQSLLRDAIERGSIGGQTGTTEILIGEVNKILSSTRITWKKGREGGRGISTSGEGGVPRKVYTFAVNTLINRTQQ